MNQKVAKSIKILLGLGTMGLSIGRLIDGLWCTTNCSGDLITGGILLVLGIGILAVPLSWFDDNMF